MKKSLLLYYSLLIGLLFTWSSPELPHIMLRLLFLILVLLPIAFSNTRLLPCVLSTFVIISANRHVPSYMPFLPIYLAVTTILVMVLRRFKRGKAAPIPLIFLLIFTFLVNLLRSMSIESMTMTALIVVLFYSFIDTDVQARSREVSISLVIISFLLCLETLVLKGDSTYSLMVDNVEFERVGWNDPNYFTSIIGMGGIAALNLLVSVGELKKLYRAMLIGVIMLVITVSLLVASRGAVLAIFISGMVLLIYNRRQSRIIMRLLLILVVFLVLLYQFGAFDFLISRFINDGGEIGGRTIIWQRKIADFAAQASLLDWLVGIGYKDGFALSSYVGDRAYIGFHNDYLAMLVSYGIIGLILTIAMYLYPICKYKDTRVTANCLYAIIISLSIEPLYSGGLAIFYFYFYTSLIGEASRQKDLLLNIRTNTKYQLYNYV